MTTEDKDAVVGRLVQERRDLRAHELALRESAAKIGAFFRAVGSGLESLSSAHQGGRHAMEVTPRGIAVRGLGYDARVTVGHLPTQPEIAELLNDLATTENKLAEIEGKLKPFGV